MITLFNGDCLEYMRTMDAGSVDAVITDPPYEVQAGAGGGAFGNRAHLIKTGGFTDKGVDYSFLSSFENWTCFCSKKQLSKLISSAENNCDNWNLITWAKPNPVPTCNNKYLPDSEYIIHGWKVGKLFGSYEDKQSFFIEKFGERYSNHPNEKPLRLIIKLIKLTTKIGDTIFDPFMGSGTTGVAAVQLGRNFIGCELDAGYFAIAQRRIHEATLQPQLFQVEKPPAEKQGGLL